MAKILFKGSTHFPGVDRRALLGAAEALGYSGAARGHVLLVGSERPNTIDQHVTLGVTRFCRSFPQRSAHIEIHRPDDGKVPFASPGALNVRVDRYPHGLSPSGPSGGALNWVVAHVGALDASDVLVILGGGDGTELAGHVAMERRWPIVPIAWFGGAARTLYNAMGYQLRRQPLIASKLHLLNEPWQETSADALLDLIESVVTRPPQSYFVSYSHSDAAAADRVELLLRRDHRGVLRDERVLSPGDSLDASITTRIAMATTFVALHSNSYAGSDYCRGELALAHDLKRGGSKPLRIVGLRLDQAPLSPLLAGNVWLDASARISLDSAVRELITTETAPGPMPPARS